jgi:hypothetical protein
VIKLGSNSRKYQKEATGNNKKGRKSTTSAGKGKILLQKGTPQEKVWNAQQNARLPWVYRRAFHVSS